jgi:hypothetical protein
MENVVLFLPPIMSRQFLCTKISGFSSLIHFDWIGIANSSMIFGSANFIRQFYPPIVSANFK